MKTEQVTFGELEQGDRFALNSMHFKDGDIYLNMKVSPAVLCDDQVKHIPYNVIRLSNGSVRTFQDDTKVWIVK